MLSYNYSVTAQAQKTWCLFWKHEQEQLQFDITRKPKGKMSLDKRETLRTQKQREKGISNKSQIKNILNIKRHCPCYCQFVSYQKTQKIKTRTNINSANNNVQGVEM